MDMQVSDLDKALAQLGPQFAAVTDKHDEEDSFVADNYDALKEHRVFSALVPVELGGGNRLLEQLDAVLGHARQGLERQLGAVGLVGVGHQPDTGPDTLADGANPNPTPTKTAVCAP